MYENLHYIHINDEYGMEFGENCDIIRTVPHGIIVQGEISHKAAS